MRTVRMWARGALGEKHDRMGVRFERSPSPASVSGVMLRFVLGIVLVLFVLAIAAFASQARAAPAAERVALPERSALYRIKLEREAIAVFGIDAPVAMVAAQIHAESHFKADALAPDGGMGLMQFMPATAAWIASITPECHPADPWDPDWAVRCGIRYDYYLYQRTGAATRCDRFAFTLAKYNGGEKYLQFERDRARLAGADPSRWFGQVEPHRARSAAAHKINRRYVRKVLLVLEPAYVAAGWPGGLSCSGT